MKRDTTMAMLMANHVIAMIKAKRAQEDEQIKGTKPQEKKEHPVKEAIQKFFDSNRKAFGCERDNAVKLMTALTGFEFMAEATCGGGNYYDQYSVITSLISYSGSNITTKQGSVLLVGSANGRVFTPDSNQTVTSQTVLARNDARRATDEEYAAFMKELDTDAGKTKLVTWMAHSGLADTIFGLKLAE